MLAAVGLYSVMAHVASQRRTEIGIRLALGARRAAIVRLVMTDGLWLVAIGAAIGRAGAVPTAGLVRQQLFGVQPVDPATYAGVAAVLVGVGAIACAVPAWRAMRIDPADALRNV